MPRRFSSSPSGWNPLDEVGSSVTERGERFWSPAWTRVSVAAALGFTLLLASSPARAEDSVDKAGRQLKGDDDSRVRISAAVALGKSGSRRAVPYLCGGLDDSDSGVRVAAANGLGRLAMGGKKCLTTRKSKESTGDVKRSIEKALKLVAAAALKITGSTLWVVSVASPASKGASASAAREAFIAGLRSQSEFGISPWELSDEEAQKIVDKHSKVTVFHLLPAVKTSTSGETVTVEFRIDVSTSPGKVLRGSFPLKLSADGMKEADLAKEAGTRAAKKLGPVMGRFK